MSEAFRKAVEHIEQSKARGVAETTIQIDFPEFEQGTFKVNRVYEFKPLIIGMLSPEEMVGFDDAAMHALKRFARRRGLSVRPSGTMIWLRDKGGQVVAILKEAFLRRAALRAAWEA